MTPDDEARLIAEAEQRRGATSGPRSAEPGELCTCGRPAAVVHVGGLYGDVGECYSGPADGGPKPCVFCSGQLEHEADSCPWYRLTLDAEPHPRRYTETRWIGSRRLDPAGPRTVR